MPASVDGPTRTDDDMVKNEKYQTGERSGNDEGRNAITNGEVVTDVTPGEFRFGWCDWAPQAMQRFNRAPWLLTVLCGFTFAQVI